MLAGSLILSFIKSSRRQGLLLSASLVLFLGASTYSEGPYDPRWEHLLDSLGWAFGMSSIGASLLMLVNHLLKIEA
jgi:hypothetical protein